MFIAALLPLLMLGCTSSDKIILQKDNNTVQAIGGLDVYGEDVRNINVEGIGGITVTTDPTTNTIYIMLTQPLPTLVTSVFESWGIDTNDFIGDVLIWADQDDLNTFYISQIDANTWYLLPEDFNTYGDQRYISDWNGYNWFSNYFSNNDVNLNLLWKAGVSYSPDDLNANAFQLCDDNKTLTGANNCVPLTGFHSGSVVDTDETIKISSNDTTADYLLNKLTAGEGIDLTEIGDGGNEDLQIDGEDASTTNKGIFSIAAGSGITIAGGTACTDDSIVCTGFNLDDGSTWGISNTTSILGGSSISSTAASNTITLDLTMAEMIFTGFGIDGNATTGDVLFTANLTDLNSIYLRTLDINGQNWFIPTMSAYDLNIGNSIFKGATEYPLEDLNANAFSLCDGNQALTGANNCVDLTGFDLDNYTPPCDNNTDCEYTGSLNIGAGESVTVTSPDVNYTVIFSSDLNAQTIYLDTPGSVICFSNTCDINMYYADTNELRFNI